MTGAEKKIQDIKLNSGNSLPQNKSETEVFKQYSIRWNACVLEQNCACSICSACNDAEGVKLAEQQGQPETRGDALAAFWFAAQQMLQPITHNRRQNGRKTRTRSRLRRVNSPCKFHGVGTGFKGC